MLAKNKLTEIKELLENSQNPLFFFDNDADGICSYAILRRALGRGKGVVIKSFPSLGKQYFHKIEELNPDTIIILDKPKVSKEFVEKIKEKNLPIIWIDHHDEKIDKEILEYVNYFNSSPTSEPVTFIAQKIFNRKQDKWLAMIGCIGDVYMPNFSKEFSKEYPELFNANIEPFDALYTTEIGKAVQLINFGLKDTTTNTLKLMRLLVNSKSIYDLFEENTKTQQLQKRFKELNNTYKKLIEKAKLKINKDGKLIFFVYAGKTSMSSEVSNRLYFDNKDKLIVVMYRHPDKINISIRGENARDVLLQAIKNMSGAHGGGHEKACGATIPFDKLREFQEKIEKIINL